MAGGILGDLISSLADVFENGLDIYGNVKERVVAIEKIGDDTVDQASTQILTPEQQKLQDSAAKAINMTSLALIAAGILCVVLVVMVVRRRKRG
jgi:hypothetical protein